MAKILDIRAENGIKVTADTVNKRLTFATDTDSTIISAPTERVQSLGTITGAVTINGALGNIITMTTTGAIAFTLAAGSAAGTCRVLTLIIRNGGSSTISWPVSVNWNGTAPTLTATGGDIVTLVTTDAGATWLGMLSGGGFA